ncbi:MAG TPA: methyltransferase domain-containing protein [Solirubrobacteraceae bacterium]|nr:methyltransferase domain-containing protein [Solirubrobacteraceae bacterium]
MSDIEQLLEGQAHYYRERAGEYDDWWFRRGRYDHGEEANARWAADAAEVASALERFKPSGTVLELACGTGLWTERLAAHADSVTAVDAASEMIEINRARMAEVAAESARADDPGASGAPADDPGAHGAPGDGTSTSTSVRIAPVTYVEADLFAWEPRETYDVCFFSFWLSHVPEERFAAFWEQVKRALAPGGRVFFIDSTRHDLASAVDHKLPGEAEDTMLRRLADGREFQIVKRFYEPARLQQRLADIGWTASVDVTSEFFVYGEAGIAS